MALNIPQWFVSKHCTLQLPVIFKAVS